METCNCPKVNLKLSGTCCSTKSCADEFNWSQSVTNFTLVKGKKRSYLITHAYELLNE